LRPYSFIILSYNDEMHLPRLFNSIKGLEADIYALDSGSTDQTINICKEYSVEVSYHPFENHPKQWHEALGRFPIKTPWIIALDADQIVTPNLFHQLRCFEDNQHKDVNGIYFNRKNFHKGKWIRHGGYFPFYMLKMFRLGIGISDLNENMDHRFLVSGKTIIWKEGYLLEENLKESKVSFWIEKHNRYSDQLAVEEVERMLQLRLQIIKPNLWGSPNERKAAMKLLWWKMPRYLRPALYFGYRMVFQLGILDGRTGIIFHFLQAFWFRLIVDVKIEELLSQQTAPETHIKRFNEVGSTETGRQRNLQQKVKSIRLLNSIINYTGLKAKLTLINKLILKSAYYSEIEFMISFLYLFILSYGFNIAFIGITAPGGIYWHWADEHINYIRAWRNFDLQTTSSVLKLLGHKVYINWYSVVVPGYAGFKLVYSCLGYGLMSFFLAFILAFPKDWKSKIWIILIGLGLIQTLNLLRFVMIALYWNKQVHESWPDHHFIWNTTIYLVIITILYLWTNSKKHAYQFKKKI
jgi:exosortase/archaeosortase family protein